MALCPCALESWLQLGMSRCASLVQCWEDVEDVKREVEIMESLKGHPHIIRISNPLRTARYATG